MRIRRSVWIVAAFVPLAISVIYFGRQFPDNNPKIGVTYSTDYAEYLGLNPVEAWESMVTDLGVRLARIPVYWDRIELLPGVYDWTELDNIMTVAKNNDVKIILAVGRKVPRWPECHLPKWADELEGDAQDEAVIVFTEEVVKRYRAHPSLLRWQIENEPFIRWYGNCGSETRKFVESEIARVKALDGAHTIQTTASGEQSLWTNEVDIADLVGVSVYNKVCGVLGCIKIPMPAAWYRMRARLVGREKIVVSELQAEPWFQGSFRDISADEAASRFSATDLKERFLFAKSIGSSEILFWGAEWWLFLKQNERPELWNEAREYFFNERR